jgi:hypothetical protein
MDLSKKCAGVFMALVLMAGMAFAQQTDVTTQEGLVNVDVSNIRADIAKDINVDVSQIPVTVQVPVDVAANVCNVAVDVLTSQVAQGGGKCEAKSTSSALNQVVQDQLKSQK